MDACTFGCGCDWQASVAGCGWPVGCSLEGVSWQQACLFAKYKSKSVAGSFWEFCTSTQAQRTFISLIHPEGMTV